MRQIASDFSGPNAAVFVLLDAFSCENRLEYGDDVSRADAANANIKGVRFKNVNLKGTGLCGAGLSGVRNLAAKQLRRAVIDETTMLPPVPADALQNSGREYNGHHNS